ncbi:unnamed protein product [Thelazia callipaeda]|uniref:Protein kinase domain-containing protein n=1 Tax=Thelazia callipaeda TaxID=103827 RepID=A0A0N5D3X3_THECL|nr:unnamed protein product [Thelazia callipaeda]
MQKGTMVASIKTFKFYRSEPGRNCSGLCIFLPLICRVTCEMEDGTKEIQNLVMVERLHHKKGCRNKGFISVTYLQPLSSSGMPKTKVGRKIQSAFDIPREILQCKWFAGRINPVEAGIWLRNDLQSSFGSYIVCQPSEIIPHNSGWPEFILVVKCLTGSEDEFYREWEEDQKHNVKYSFSMAYPTSMGSFYLFDFKEETFYTIYQLLNYYTEQKLTVDLNVPLALRYPVEFQENPVLGPKPLSFPHQSKAYKTPKQSTGLIIVPDDKDLKYDISVTSEILTKRSAFAGKTSRAVLSANGHYCEAAFKQLKSSYLKEELFEKCLNALYIHRRLSNMNLACDEQRNDYFIQGEEYLCKIAGYNIHDKVYGPWVAYEFICGHPLDMALIMRIEDGLPPLTIRANLEIMYQISAGMRYLEDNDLCHRNLRAANVLVYVQHQNSMAIKLTDYMLPLSSREIDLSLLHWRWMDPEALEYQNFDIKTDIWSFGCVMFEILNPGKLPYSLETVSIENPEKYFLSKYNLIFYFSYCLLQKLQAHEFMHLN